MCHIECTYFMVFHTCAHNVFCVYNANAQLYDLLSVQDRYTFMYTYFRKTRKKKYANDSINATAFFYCAHKYMTNMFHVLFAALFTHCLYVMFSVEFFCILYRNSPEQRNRLEFHHSWNIYYNYLYVLVCYNHN